MFSIRATSSEATNAETEPAVRTLDETLTMYPITARARNPGSRKNNMTSDHRVAGSSPVNSAMLLEGEAGFKRLEATTYFGLALSLR